MRKLSFVSLGIVLLFGFAGVASAHVVVKPATADVGSYQTFDVSVPVEKEVPVVGLRLLIPAGVQNVEPDATSGWAITTKKDSSGNVTEIDWSGTIPVGMREDFYFSAQMPAASTTLVWKAYQTYADGSIVSWDLAPGATQPTTASGTPDFSSVGPYSMTHVVNDLAAAQTPSSSGPSNTVTFAISIAALAIAIFSWFSARSKN